MILLFHTGTATVADWIALIIIVLAVSGWWATYKFMKWWSRLSPSRLMGALAIGSVVIDAAALPLVFLSAYRLINPEAPPLGILGVALLGISLVILLGVKILGAIVFRDLDGRVNGDGSTEK